MNKVPLTLVDLVSVIPKGGVSIYSIGRSYRQCLLGLQLQIPTMDPAVMIPKLFKMMMKSYDRAELPPQRQAMVLSNANMLLGFISRIESRAQHPTVLAATSIYLAMEMSMLPMPKVDDAARAFCIGETALKTKANNVRHAMAALGKHLLYGENIKAKTAMKYARVITKLSTLKSRAKATEADPDAHDAVKAAIARAIEEEDKDAGADDAEQDTLSEGNLEDVDVDEYLRTDEEISEIVRFHH